MHRSTIATPGKLNPLETLVAILIVEFFFHKTRPSEGQPEHKYSG